VSSDLSREAAEALDAADPLASLRERFAPAPPGLLYLDGNSLGRPPRSALERLATVAGTEWADELVAAWDRWIDLPSRVGDRLGRVVLGAGPGQVLVCDSTTVNLYKLGAAALDARPGRRAIVADRAEFPTDRYVLGGLASARGLELRWVEADPVEGLDRDALTRVLDEDVALVCLSHVAYRSAAVADLAGLSADAREAGALMLWDLSHSAGALPLALDRDGVDLAVGCTYKHLNAGPGAPAFLYVRRDLQEALEQPIRGWMGTADVFAMGPDYAPAPGIGHFATGTPPVLGLVLVDEGIGVVEEAGIERLRARSVGLTELAVRLHDAWLAPRGFRLGSPRDPARRGAHVALCRGDAEALLHALAAAGVVGDFRRPDVLRLGLAPLYTAHVEVWGGLDALRRLSPG